MSRSGPVYTQEVPLEDMLPAGTPRLRRLTVRNIRPSALPRSTLPCDIPKPYVQFLHKVEEVEVDRVPPHHPRTGTPAANCDRIDRWGKPERRSATTLVS